MDALLYLLEPDLVSVTLFCRTSMGILRHMEHWDLVNSRQMANAFLISANMRHRVQEKLGSIWVLASQETI